MDDFRVGSSRGAARALTFSPLGPAGPGGPMGPVRPCGGDTDDDKGTGSVPRVPRSRRPCLLTRAPSLPGAPSGPFSPTSPWGARRRRREPSRAPRRSGRRRHRVTRHLPCHPWGRRCRRLLSRPASPAALGGPGRRWGRLGRLHPKTERKLLGCRPPNAQTPLRVTAPSFVPSLSPTLGPSVPGVPGSPRGPCSPCAPGEPRSPGKPRSPCAGGDAALGTGPPGRGGGHNGLCMGVPRGGGRISHPAPP